MTNLAIVTMAHKEPDFLPIWSKHYFGQGETIVIDHGGSSGWADNTVKLPPSAHDNRKRADFVQDFTRGLLRYYDAVMFTDVDELVVPGKRWANLKDYAAQMQHPVITALGINVLHKLGEESSYDASEDIGEQRGYGFPVASMCKPVLFREPLLWSPGFHTCQFPIHFGDLFNLHLAYFDRQIALRRQEKRRRVEGASPHHQASDETVDGWIAGWNRMPVLSPTLTDHCPLRQAYQQSVIDSQKGRLTALYPIDLGLMSDKLWRLPQWMRERV